MKKKFSKVVVWGHPLNSHTHSYIHHGFYKAFQYLGYETLWTSGNEDFSDVDLRNCLFITEGQVDSNIPLIKDSYYVLHNTNAKKYLEAGVKVLTLQVYTKDVHSRGESINSYTVIQKRIEDIECLYQPWATDLLPHEIDPTKAFNSQNTVSVWVGSDQENLPEFFSECKKNKVEVRKINPWLNPISFSENKELIRNSYISPSLQSNWQVENGYIPCRVFKNLSYGHFGYTNSYTVKEIFQNEIVYDLNPVSLFYKGLDEKNSPSHVERLSFLMNEVKEKHTYINRINQILECLSE
jgi:hypothetical protein